MNAPAHIIAAPERAKLTAEDFVLLAESGAFADYRKSELIDGDIYVMNAQWSRHARVKGRLMVALSNKLAAMGSDLEAIAEVSVRLSDTSMPEPDIVLTSWQGDGPVPLETVALIVEVSDTTLDTDLGRKAGLYAAAGVPEYWVVDLGSSRVLAHDRPEDDDYQGRREIAFGETLASVTIDGLNVSSADLRA